MKEFIFKVTLITGIAFTCTGQGVNKDAALMDACESLEVTNYPEDDIDDIVLVKEIKK